MTPITSRIVPYFHGLVLVVSLACNGGESRGSPELGGGPSTGDPSLPGPPTGGLDLPADAPTTASPADSSGTGDTTADTASTGGPEIVCGDGEVDPGEECDDGDGNDDNAFCTAMCRFNFCGDGHLFVGWEVCDEGPANSDSYGSACDDQCKPGKRCGDHIVQAEEGEECDLGPANGGGKGDEQGIECEAFCTSKALRAFVTSKAFTGKLGGIAGADAKCREAASAAGLGEPERFHAYLSTPGSPANDRFPGPGAEPLPYILVTGKKFAESHAKLIYQGPGGEGISVTEFGVSVYNAHVASNTAPSGESFSPDQHCQGWTSADPLLKAHIGLSFPGDPDDYPDWGFDGEWINYLTVKCAAADLHLYCLEV